MTEDAQGTPPKTPPNMTEQDLPLGDSGIPPAGAGDSPEFNSLMAAVSRQRGAALDRPPKSLPVLAAFQEFLETERKRARNRTIILSAFFGLILVSVVTIGTLVAMLAYSNIQDKNERLEQQVSALQEKARDREIGLETALARLEGKTEAQLKALQEQQARTAAGSAATSATDEVVQHNSQIQEVRQTVAQLRNDNARLRQELGGIRSDVPQLSKQVNQLLAEIQELRSRPQTTSLADASGTPSPVAATTPTPTPGTSFRQVEIDIKPLNAVTGMRWRVAIPE